MESIKKVLLIIPSMVIARGLESVMNDHGVFKVVSILSDLSRTTIARLQNMDVDLIIVDPAIFDFQSRKTGRTILTEHLKASVIALESSVTNEEILKQYDGSINISDDPIVIMRKMNLAIENGRETPKTDSDDLSSREKEILISVAKGLLNKEIAELYNISIYTVITHRKNITKKTGIKTVAGLTVYALLNNLIDLNSIE
ncbi:MAG: response regulator transcription factor [Candidatus Cryptobacteroides sp.]